MKLDIDLDPADVIEPELLAAAKHDPRRALPNARHEKVCQLIAKGEQSNTACYLRVYPDSDEDSARANVARLITNDNVAARLQYLKEKAAAVAELEPAYVLHGLMVNSEESREKGDYSASNAALTQLGKHLRLFDEAGTVVNIANIQLEPEKRRELLAAILGETPTETED